MRRLTSFSVVPNPHCFSFCSSAGFAGANPGEVRLSRPARPVERTIGRAPLRVKSEAEIGGAQSIVGGELGPCAFGHDPTLRENVVALSQPEDLADILLHHQYRDACL